MSIENTLERIAVALEKIAEGRALDVPTAAAPAAPVKAPKAPKAAPAVAAEDTLPGTDEKVYTMAEVLETLKTLADLDGFGSEDTIALMKKHGADAATPAVRTIPPANYGALMQEAQTILKKNKGKIA